MSAAAAVEPTPLPACMSAYLAQHQKRAGAGGGIKIKVRFLGGETFTL